MDSGEYDIETASVAVTRRRRAVILVAAAVLVYVVVVLLYAFTGRSISVGTTATPSSGVLVTLNVQAVDAAGQRLRIDVEVVPAPSLLAADGITFEKPITVLISPVEGSQTLTFDAHTVSATQSKSILLDGAIEEWPFDRYQAAGLTVIAFEGSGPLNQLTPVPTTVHVTGYVPGWSLAAAAVHAGSDQTPAQLTDIGMIDLSAHRSGGTLAFAAVLLAVLVTMPCLVLFVAITAFVGRRKVEPSFMGWMGAMLFATIPLRTFLPGSPPVGSWIDVTVVLWVVAGLIAGLTIYVWAWARWALPEPRSADRTG